MVARLSELALLDQPADWVTCAIGQHPAASGESAGSKGRLELQASFELASSTVWSPYCLGISGSIATPSPTPAAASLSRDMGDRSCARRTGVSPIWSARASKLSASGPRGLGLTPDRRRPLAISSRRAVQVVDRPTSRALTKSTAGHRRQRDSAHRRHHLSDAEVPGCIRQAPGEPDSGCRTRRARPVIESLADLVPTAGAFPHGVRTGASSSREPTAFSGDGELPS